MTLSVKHGALEVY